MGVAPRCSIWHFQPQPLSMHLRDHFRPPLSERRHWHSFHSAWATFLASALNDKLPAGYFAEPTCREHRIAAPA